MTLFLALFFGWLAIHSFTTYPLSLWVFAKLKPAPAPKASGNAEKISVTCLVCSRNEEKVIERKLQEIQTLIENNPNVDAVFYNDASTDNTGKILDEVAAKNSKIQIIHAPERTGKTVGVGEVMNQTKADVILLSDATIELSEDIIRRTRSNFTDPEVGCVSGELVYINTEDSDVTQMSGMYSKLQTWLRRKETETGSFVGASGTFFAVRRKLYRKMPSWMMDDLYTSLSVLIQGKRAVIDPAIQVKRRAATETSDEFNRKVRIACRLTNVWFQLGREFLGAGVLNNYKFYSRHMLRVITLFNLGLSVFFGMIWLAQVGSFLEGLALFSLICFVFYAGVIRRWPFMPTLHNMLLMFWAGAIGVAKASAGEKYQTWETAKSIRKAA